MGRSRQKKTREQIQRATQSVRFSQQYTPRTVAYKKNLYTPKSTVFEVYEPKVKPSQNRTGRIQKPTKTSSGRFDPNLVQKLSHTESYQVGQTAPSKRPTSICDSRSLRQRIMHATGNAGRSGQKIPVWTEKSLRRCK